MTKNHDTIPPETDPELAAIWRRTGMPKFFLPRADKMTTTRKIHAQGNVRFMKSTFVKETLGSERLWTEEDRPIVVRNGYCVTIRIYRPTTFAGRRPVMVYAHSGGWCMGGVDTEEFICQVLCVKVGIIIVSVAYRLAPEWAHSTCVLDTYDTVKWVSKNAKSIGADVSKGFLTAGVSGGGNLTTMAAVLARDEHLEPPLTGHLLVCTGMPHAIEDQWGKTVTLFPDQLAHGSWEKYENGPVTTREMSALYGKIANVDAYSPLITPLTQTSYANLGPLYYQAAEMDLWHDTAPFYCEKIREAGGQARLDVYKGVVQTWWSMYPELSINRKWIGDLVQGVEWLLSLKRERGGGAFAKL